MSDPREVPPSPGTDPRLSEASLRRYREEAGQYARHRRDGTVPLTEGEIEARIVANAADLAVSGEVDETRPHPFLNELVATFWHRLYRNHEVRERRLASYDHERRRAAARLSLVGDDLRNGERRLRELRSQRVRMPRPVTGTTLTQPVTLLYCLLPGIVIEVFGTAPSLRAAFDLSEPLSWLFAAAISCILILAADQLGNTMASTTSRSRRLTTITAGFLVTVAVGAGIWALVSLAHSRETNIAYTQGSERALSTTPTGGEFSASGQLSGSDKTNSATPQVEAEASPSHPDYDFFIPLSLLIIATATLVAYRIELANEWNELSLAIAEFEEGVDDAREEEAAATMQLNEAPTPENEAILEVSALVERERALLSLWIGRFAAEYQRFCAAADTRPAALATPTLPETHEVLDQILDPRQRQPQSPGEAPRTNSNGGDPEGTSPNGDGPEQEMRPPPPTPPPPPDTGDQNGNGRSGPEGAPRGFGRG